MSQTTRNHNIKTVQTNHIGLSRFSLSLTTRYCTSYYHTGTWYQFHLSPCLCILGPNSTSKFKKPTQADYSVYDPTQQPKYIASTKLLSSIIKPRTFNKTSQKFSNHSIFIVIHCSSIGTNFILSGSHACSGMQSISAQASTQLMHP